VNAAFLREFMAGLLIINVGVYSRRYPDYT